MAVPNSPSDISLDDNTDCLVNNPLKDLSLSQLDRDASVFATEVEADRRLFQKAARLAQDPRSWESVQHRFGLTKKEQRALEGEREKGFWQQPKYLKLSVVTLCFSAIIQGWMQTGLNGANSEWPRQFGLTDEQGQFRNSETIWIFAIVNAVTFLAASLFGCWLSDPLQSLLLSRRKATGHRTAALGRRGAIFISCCLILAALVGSACTHTWKQLLACRAILGLGMGAKASITPIFGAELSPSHLRGQLVMSWQVFDALGIFLGFTANLILYRVGPLSWRFQVASTSLPTICLMILCWSVPESPRWLLKQGRIAEAYESMCLIRDTPLQAAREIFYINAQLQIETSLVSRGNVRASSTDQTAEASHIEDVEAEARQPLDLRDAEDAEVHKKMTRFQVIAQRSAFSYWRRILQLFLNKRTRRATVAAGIVMISQQLCGINLMAFYSTTFFRDVNGKSIQDDAGRARKQADQAVWMSWGFGLSNFLFAIPAYYMIDRIGRRALLLLTYPGMIVGMLGACLAFLAERTDTRYGLVGFFLYLFVVFYSLGQGPVAFTYSSEVFPLINREAGMSFAVFVNFLGAGLLTLFVPQAQTSSNSRTLGNPTEGHTSYESNQTKLLGIFVAFNVLAMTLIFFFVPETGLAIIKASEGQLIYLSLEELNYIFAVPTWTHAEYQVRIMLPYHIKCIIWALFGRWRGKGKPDRPEKLYIYSDRRESMHQTLSQEQKVVQTLGFSSPHQIYEMTPITSRSADRHDDRSAPGDGDQIGNDRS